MEHWEAEQRREMWKTAEWVTAGLLDLLLLLPLLEERRSLSHAGSLLLATAGLTHGWKHSKTQSYSRFPSINIWHT